MSITMTVTDPRVDVLGVRVSITSIADALERIGGWIDRREQHYVCVSGVHGVMESQRDPELRRIHNASGLTVPDGAPLLWAGRYVGAAGMGRVRGPDLMPALAERAADRGWRIYCYGAAPGVAERLADRLCARYPGLTIVGAASPPFGELDPDVEAPFIDEINAAKPDIVFVGMSTPKQERWMSWALGRVTAPALLGFGAAFDIHAGLVEEAPAWIRPTGFEWAYRMARSPRRLGSRYLKHNPRFVAAVLRTPPRLHDASQPTQESTEMVEHSAHRTASRAAAARHTVAQGIAPKSLLKRAAVTALTSLERSRLHLLPAHFYSSVPQRRWLRENEELWRRPTELPGLRWRLDEQIDWLARICAAPYLNEVRGFGFLRDLDARGIDFRYGAIEAQVLHCTVRTFAPKRIVEIGSGASTAIMSAAVSRTVADGGQASEITTIDPYAPAALRHLPHVSVREIPAQRVPVETVTGLDAGDLLFIDSTHAVKTGSELHRIYLELLPSLPSGVLVHIHDIYLPYQYSPSVLDDIWDWQETALLSALLIGNDRFEVLSCQSALHHARPDALAAVLPDYRPRPMTRGIDDGRGSDQHGGHFPSSMWLRTR